MALVDLDFAKQHLRVDHSDDDELITAYLLAAEAIATEHVDRPIVSDGEVVFPAIAATPAIIAAVLLLMADLYSDRETDTVIDGSAILPRTVRALLAPYRYWRPACEDPESVG